jgi:DNA-binding MarR family transcriptional regulator
MRIEDEIKQTKPFPNPQTKAAINLSFTASWMSSIQTQLLKPYGLSMQQYNILRILKGIHPKPATVKVLIERMIDRDSNASRLVEKLKKKQLVERNACEEDRRRVDVVITEKGLETLDDLSGLIKLSQDKIHLSDEEADILSNLLDKMRG